MTNIESIAKEILDILAIRLEQCRKARGLTQGQAAEYEGVTQGYISNLENGHNRPSVIPILARLAKRYNTSMDYLCGLTSDPTPASRRELSPAVREMRDVFEDLNPMRQDELLALARAMLDNQRRINDPEAETMNFLIKVQSGDSSRAVKEMT
jgi:transcriptional regulator with XRE-family HTH domain